MSARTDHTVPLRHDLRKRLEALDTRIISGAEAELERLLLDLKSAEQELRPILDYLLDVQANLASPEEESGEETQDTKEGEGTEEGKAAEGEGKTKGKEGEAKKPNKILEACRRGVALIKSAIAAIRRACSLFIRRKAFSLQILAEALAADSGSPLAERLWRARSGFFAEDVSPEDLEAALKVIHKSSREYRDLQEKAAGALRRPTPLSSLKYDIRRSDPFIRFYREVERLTEHPDPLVINAWGKDGIASMDSRLAGIASSVDQCLQALWRKTADSYLRRLGRRHLCANRIAARDIASLRDLSLERDRKTRQQAGKILRKIHHRLDG